jgi:hypothetical protein
MKKGIEFRKGTRRGRGSVAAVVSTNTPTITNLRKKGAIDESMYVLVSNLIAAGSQSAVYNMY